jgi:capsular polysaccharide biosynthesis protein
MVTCTSNSDAQVATIGATAKTPKIAAAISNKTTEVFTAHAKDLLDLKRISLLSVAKANYKPIIPKTNRDVLLGALAGGVLSILWMGMLIFVEDHKRYMIEKLRRDRESNQRRGRYKFVYDTKALEVSDND